MPRGRIPKPAAVNSLRGDSHGRRRNQIEPTPPANRPECPDYLDDIAKAEWSYTCDQLDKMGLLSSADRACIEFYCLSYSEYRIAQTMVTKYGRVLISPKTKQPYDSPYLNQMKSAMESCRKLLAEMGLTPAARSRCRATQTQDNGNSVFVSQFLKAV